LLGVSVHAADVQDRDGAHDLLRLARQRFPFVERIFADGRAAPDDAARLLQNFSSNVY
jgi:putative transposase